MDSTKLRLFLDDKYHLSTSAECSQNKASLRKHNNIPLPENAAFITGNKICSMFCDKCDQDVLTSDGRILQLFYLKTRSRGSFKGDGQMNNRLKVTARIPMANGKLVPSYFIYALVKLNGAYP